MFFLVLCIVSGLSIGVIPVFADDVPDITSGLNESVSLNASAKLPGNETGPNMIAGKENLTEEIKGLTVKEPKSYVIFAGVTNTTESSVPGDETSIESVPDNATNSTRTYESLGDIIKAKDWKALGEYNCRIKAENPEKFEDSGAGDQESRWNSYFTAPQTFMYTPCCG